MNDILPPKRPQVKPQIPSADPPKPQVLLEEPEAHPLLEAPKRRSKLKMTVIILIVAVVLVAAAAIAAVSWYQSQLQPADSGNKQTTRFIIETGTSPDQIGKLLEEKRLIRSSLAFDIYTRLSGVRSALKAGSYSLSPSESTSQIVSHLASGKVDEFSVTFLPGATVADHKKVLVKAGYSEADIEAAFSKTYDHPLFADKPVGTDLEGYIYGETYSFETSASVEQILIRTFEEFYKVVKDQNIIDTYARQNLNLYQGITLASIIQKEVSRADDQRQVAQVFLKRLRDGMPLGADATFVYAAKKLGVTPSVNLDSLYNTRIHAGLPPGPIASPGKTALEAAGNPAAGDFVFFVSGDDGATHFSHTQAEHEAKTRQYCHKNCSLF